MAGLGGVGLRKLQPDEHHEVFRTLLHDVSTALADRYDIMISESFVIMMVKLIALDHTNKFILKQPVIKMEMDRLLRCTVELVAGMTAIQRNIIRMQFHYRGNHFPKAELIQAHRSELERQVEVYMSELRESPPKQLRQYELYYRKLIIVIITMIDLGTPNNTAVVKETEAALSSVFPMEEIGLLSNITPENREIEIRNLIKITAGIRIYNYRLDDSETLSGRPPSNNHGFGIEDVLAVLPDRIYRCALMLSEMREVNIERLIRYTTLIKPYFMEETNVATTKVGRANISQDMLWVRQGLVMVHQILVYIKELSDELTLEDETCEACTMAFNKCMAELKTTVQDNSTVPTFVIYPKFIELAESWRRLQESLTFMETLMELASGLKEYSENDLKQVDTLVQQLSNSMDFPDENQFFDFPVERIADDDMVLAIRSDFESHMDPLSMMYSGFCVWSLVNGLGIVLLSNPNLGVFNWRDRQFLLANARAADEFRRDPDLFTYKAIFIARRWPELIFLLRLENQVFNPDVQVDSDRIQASMQAKVRIDTSVQTELHPLESNIVRGYTWNEWEYRRRAVDLSKLCHCSTHGTQTYIQSLKSNTASQTYRLKKTKVQTMHDKYAEVPMSQFYMWGLRGCHQHPPHVVELIRDCALCLRCFAPHPSKDTTNKKKNCKVSSTL